MKDVLNAIAQLHTETKADLARVRSEMASKADLAELDANIDAHRAETTAHHADLEAKIDAHRAETKAGFEALDKELTAHAGTHREIEKDLEALKRRPARTAARATRPPRSR